MKPLFFILSASKPSLQHIPLYKLPRCKEYHGFKDSSLKDYGWMAILEIGRVKNDDP
jgi:hypothetical protein